MALLVPEYGVYISFRPCPIILSISFGARTHRTAGARSGRWLRGYYGARLKTMNSLFFGTAATQGRIEWQTNQPHLQRTHVTKFHAHAYFCPIQGMLGHGAVIREIRLAKRMANSRLLCDGAERGFLLFYTHRSNRLTELKANERTPIA